MASYLARLGSSLPLANSVVVTRSLMGGWGGGGGVPTKQIWKLEYTDVSISAVSAEARLLGQEWHLGLLCFGTQPAIKSLMCVTGSSNELLSWEFRFFLYLRK
jgi:hypothetical protein